MMRKPVLEDFRIEIYDGEDYADWYENYYKALERYIDHFSKNIKDIENWLRSELQQERQPKMGKRQFNEEKIKLLEKILGKLENSY